jgi:hypothetical protein
MCSNREFLQRHRVDLWQEIHTINSPLDRDLFREIAAGWPDWLQLEWRKIVKDRFGDENITRPSILAVMNKLRPWPLDSLTQAALIHLGNTGLDFGSENALEEALAKVRRHCFFVMAASPDLGFECLRNLSAADGAKLIRGLAIAEECGCSRAGGSVSMVNWAFPVFQQSHPTTEWAALADWIVINTSNDYIPFNFRRTRYQWEECRVGSTSPSETWSRVNQAENARGREKTERLIRGHCEAAERAKAKAERLAAVRQEHENKRINHERVREGILRELVDLSPLQRFKRICEEFDFPLDAIPTDYANPDEECLRSMPIDLRDALIHRLKERRKGPWKELCVRLQNITPDQKNS